MEDVFVGGICLILASSTTGYTGVRVDTSTWLGKQLLLKQLMENTFSYILVLPQAIPAVHRKVLGGKRLSLGGLCCLWEHLGLELKLSFEHCAKVADASCAAPVTC